MSDSVLRDKSNEAKAAEPKEWLALKGEHDGATFEVWTNGAIKIEVCGSVHVMAVREWHAAAVKAIAVSANPRTPEPLLMQIAHIVMGFHNEDSHAHHNMLCEIEQLIADAAPQLESSEVAVVESAQDAARPAAVAAPVFGPEKQNPDGTVYRVGSSTGATLPPQPAPSSSVREQLPSVRSTRSTR